MNNEIYVLTLTAASIGFFHTLFGPDHYLPFIVISKARNWSLLKTTFITVLCGIGHVLSSVVLGLIGIGAGVIVGKLEIIESVRGDLAAWALMAFGFAYMIYGIKRVLKEKSHGHSHHISDKKNITPWVLFIIFVLGPCEPLIPILMYPAAMSSVGGMLLITGIFAATTITTMTVIVIVSSYGFSFLPLNRMEKFSHAMAGGIILLSGVAIKFLGL